jgi:hypothetical protein
MKNWLIRTKNNHILGPVSKNKLVDLYKNGSIKSDDEISSGNGYWFFVREKELVDRFLMGDEPQGFNPVQEAENMLTAKPEEPANDNELSLDEGDSLTPSDDDLAYPDLGSDDVVELDEAVNDEVEMSADDLEYPEMDSVVDEPVAEKKNEEIEPDFSDSNIVDINSAPKAEVSPKEQEYFDSLKPKKENVDLKAPVHPGTKKKDKSEFIPPDLPPRVTKKSFLTVNVLLSLVIIFLVLLGVAIYFRGSILKAIKSVRVPTLIKSSYAQQRLLVQKKNSGA